MSRRYLVPGLALLALWPAVSAAGPLDLHLDLRLGVLLDSGGVIPDRTGYPVPEGWTQRFQPAHFRGIQHQTAWLCWRTGFSLEPALSLGRWSLGIPVYYHLLNNFSPLDQPLEEVSLGWWDVVVLQQVVLRRVAPAFGLSLRWDTPWDFAARLQVTAQPYQLLRKDYQGSDCAGCPNSSTVVDSTVLRRGWAGRLDLRFAPRFQLRRWFNFGVYLERDFGEAWQVGLVWDFNIVRLVSSSEERGRP